ncbi:MAG TPA: YbaB/EbfC family nucleoid-associated protein [Peptococcaceae bacterium]|nr:YbaB/EbfC family nucleoid-associated protein [Peptococcaceae bacterium]
MGFGNMQKMLKQVQKIQAEMARIQEELAGKTVETTAGGGAVRAVANGQLELVEIKVDPAAIDPEDPELLEDLLLAAVNEALRKAREMVAEEMGKVTGGLKIPGLF